jgi:hypothetical protein
MRLTQGHSKLRPLTERNAYGNVATGDASHDFSQVYHNICIICRPRGRLTPPCLLLLPPSDGSAYRLLLLSYAQFCLESQKRRLMLLFFRFLTQVPHHSVSRARMSVGLGDPRKLSLPRYRKALSQYVILTCRECVC